jgi:AraC-like DNA-binding protein
MPVTFPEGEDASISQASAIWPPIRETRGSAMKSSVLVATTLDTVPESDRIDAWRDACSEALLGDLVWPTRPGANLRGTLRRRWIDDLLFVEWESNGFGARYWPNSSANDYIGFGVYPADYEERLTMRDERKLTAWGATYLWDNARVREFEQVGGGRSCIIFVPRDAVRAGGSRMAGGVDLVIRPSTPAARLLAAMVGTLHDEPEHIEPAQAVAIRNSLLELICRVPAESCPSSNAAVSGTMRHSIETWIERRIHLGPVPPTEAALAHGISLRSLYRLFEDSDESFRSVVQAARVSRARRDVIETMDSFQSIAMRWGFSDASHFSRELRRTYGKTPRELRADSAAT